MGVFSSWETLERNSFRISSICSFFSMSLCSSLLAVFSSEIVSLKFIGHPVKMISQHGRSHHFRRWYIWPQNPDLPCFLESSVSSWIGLVICLESQTARIIPKTTPAIRKIAKKFIGDLHAVPDARPWARRMMKVVAVVQTAPDLQIFLFIEGIPDLLHWYNRIRLDQLHPLS